MPTAGRGTPSGWAHALARTAAHPLSAQNAGTGPIASTSEATLAASPIAPATPAPVGATRRNHVMLEQPPPRAAHSRGEARFDHTSGGTGGLARLARGLAGPRPPGRWGFGYPWVNRYPGRTCTCGHADVRHAGAIRAYFASFAGSADLARKVCCPHLGRSLAHRLLL